MPKDGFIIYKSFYEPIKNLSDRQLGRLFRALFDYQLEKSTQVDADLQMAFAFFKNQMDIDEGKYQKVVQRNKQNGSNGGRPPKEENPKNPVGLKKPKKPDNDKDKEKDKDNDVITEPPKTGIIKMDDYAKHDVDDLYKSYISTEYQAVRESVCMAKYLKMDQVLKLSQQFTMHLKAQGEFKKTMKDYMSHFNNWLNKQPKPEPASAEPRRKTSAELLKQQGY